MATNKEEIAVKAGVDHTAIQAGLDRVDTVIKSWAGRAKGLFNDAFKGIATAFGVEKIISQLNELGEKARRIRAESKAMDVSTATLQALPKMVVAAGGNGESAERGLRLLSEKIGDARTGATGAIEEFEKWGIALEDANGAALSTDSILGQIMDKMKGTGDATKRAAMAQDLFGRAGKEMVAVLMQGAEALEKKKDSFGIFTDANLEALDRGYSAILKLSKGIGYLATQIVLFPVSGLQKIATVAGVMSVGGNQTREGWDAALAGQSIHLDGSKEAAKRRAEEDQRENHQSNAELRVKDKERAAKNASLDERIAIEKEKFAEAVAIERKMFDQGKSEKERESILDEISKHYRETEKLEKEKKEITEKELKARKKELARLDRDQQHAVGDFNKVVDQSMSDLYDKFKPSLEQLAASGHWKHRKGGRTTRWIQGPGAREANQIFDLQADAENAFMRGDEKLGKEFIDKSLKLKGELASRGLLPQDKTLTTIAQAAVAMDEKLNDIAKSVSALDEK